MLDQNLNIELLDQEEVFAPAFNSGTHFPNYLISNRGRAYSYNVNRIVIPKIKNGYAIYRFNVGGKRCYVPAHRLVAFAFIENPNPEKFKIINHIDENSLNNDVGNLEWCDDKYNLNHATAQARRAKKRSKTTQQIALDGNIIAEFISLNEASRTLHLPLNALWKGCVNRTQYNGYYWRYADDTEKEVKNALF